MTLHHKTRARSRPVKIVAVRENAADAGGESRLKNDGAQYDRAELEFLKAIDAWRTRQGRLPTLVEVLAIARGLGYRRDTPDSGKG